MAAGGTAWATVTLAGCAGLTDDDEAVEPDDEEPVDVDDDEEEEPEPEPENYVVTDDMLAGSAYIPEGIGGFAQACAPQRQFVPGMQTVFKVGVFDPTTGSPVDDGVVDEAVVDTDRGATIELEYDDEDEEWGGSWAIPDDEDAGSVGYTVEVTNDGQFHNVGVLESEFEIIEFDDPSNYVVTDDVITIDTPDGAGGYAQSCAPQHQFSPGMTAQFQIGVYDGNSGEPVGTDTLDEVTVDPEIADPLELEYDEDDAYWSANWTIPDDAEEGTVAYTVEVTNDGEFHRVGVASSEIAVIDG